MSAVAWSGEFEDTVRRHLPGLPDDEPVTAELAMPDHGLNSLRMVSLLIALEDRFDITFPDELLAANPFATVGSLWTAFTGLVPLGVEASTVPGSGTTTRGVR